MSESHNHEVLKWKALEWLYLVQKCRYVALEVKYGDYIFDVLGSDGRRVWIIEAKQSMDDYQKDCNDPKIIKENILLYKEAIKNCEDKKTYLDLIEKERKKSIKLLDESLLKISTFRYVIAPDSMLTTVPEHWGLLNEEPRLIIKSTGNAINSTVSEKIIRTICRRNTKQLLEKQGVLFEKIVQFPKMELI